MCLQYQTGAVIIKIIIIMKKKNKYFFFLHSVLCNSITKNFSNILRNKISID